MIERASPAELVTKILEPRSVAVIGASEDLRKPGARVLRNVILHGFQGQVFPLGLRSDVIQDLQAYPSIEALPVVPDLAIIAVPIAGALAAYRACALAGVPVVAMLSAPDPRSSGQQKELLALALEYPGTRLLGPNSLGIHSARVRFAGSFMTVTLRDFSFQPSEVFVISQSGGVGAYILSTAHAAGFPIDGFVSTGSEIDITFANLLRGIVDHSAPRLVFAYLEGSYDVHELVDALKYAHDHGTPVLLLRAGATSLGRKPAERHSGLPPIDDETWHTQIDPTGILTADGIEQIVDVGRTVAHPLRPRGRRLSVVSASGGAGVLMADAAARCGLELADWNEPETSELVELLPTHAAIDNPIDATGAIFSSMSTLQGVLKVCVSHPGTDVVVLTLGNMPHLEDRLFEEISMIAGDTQKLVAVVWAGGSPDAIRRLAQHGVLAFSDSVRCAGALRRAIMHPTLRAQTGDAGPLAIERAF